MGTKVEYSINLLAAAATPVESNNLTVKKSVDVWENYQNNKELSNNKGDDQIGTKNQQFSSMERMVDTNNLEFIRKTMQMHEDIFKHQVEELHRVYRVQKLLMDELKKKEIKEKKPWNQPETTKIPNGATDLQAHQSLKDEICSRDRSTGSCSAEGIIVTKIPKRGFDLEMPAEEEGECPGEAGPSSYTEEEIELDLTLSIGGSNNNETKKKRKKENAKPHGVELSRKLNLCGCFKSDRVGECSDPTTPMSSSSVTFEQERKESHWLISQGLKLT
ncbi:hypothetical protein QN277_026548 [Acacia crassicarpa]|uniref:Uncharacterized protein n=1 Tax=Acacia crassicarpa TaxID=499986 RepID=A0AAE1J854_9FABA|nr:hypothetical protein QN277_026548 [Acacia crassicarpa]